jgi:hypothetical protein
MPTDADDRTEPLALESRPRVWGWATPGLASAALGALLFSPALWSGRIADDFVLEQTLARTGGVGWAFSHNDLGQSAGHFYRPLWVLWNLLLSRISSSPLLAHAGNLVLYALVCAEVVVLVWRLTRRPAGAWCAGLLFAVLPSHGESVAWISGNTDLLAAVLVLGCVLLATGMGAGWRRESAVFLLACAAMLAKEIAFVLPVLLALTLWAAPQGHPAPAVTGWRSPRWRPAGAALLAAVAMAILHAVVIGGAGGYGPTFTVRRLAGSAVSFALAMFSPPQAPLIRHPVFLLIPVGLLIAGIALALRTLRGGDRSRARLGLLGVGWCVVALVPVLNQPLDLNTRNGDRLLLLASVGVVIAVSAVVDLRRLGGRCVLAALVLGCAASCVQNAFAWHAAGVESARLIADVDRLAGPSGSIAVLSFPSDLGEAHLFPDALESAVQESGRPHAHVITCAPMHPQGLHSGQTRFIALAHGVWLGRTSAENPFTVGLLSADSVSAGPGCLTGRISHAPSAGLGTTLEVYSRPRGLIAPQNLLYFDGENFRRALSGRTGR